MPPFSLNSRPLGNDIGIAGLAEETCLCGLPRFIAEGQVHGGGQPRHGRVAEEDEGVQEEEGTTEAAGMRAG